MADVYKGTISQNTMYIKFNFPYCANMLSHLKAKGGSDHAECKCIISLAPFA